MSPRRRWEHGTDPPPGGNPCRRCRRLFAAHGAGRRGYTRPAQVHLRQLVNPKIKEYRGRIVKNTGDGMLAEFSSVVNAVRCAVEVQRGMANRNAQTTEDQRIVFRV